MLRAIHNMVQDLEDESRDPREGLCIILRNTQDSILLEWVLYDASIHYACQGMKPFFMRREIALVLMLMWAVQGKDNQPGGERYLSQGILEAGCEGLHHFGQRHQYIGDVSQDSILSSRFDDDSWHRAMDLGTRHTAGTIYKDVSLARLLITRGVIGESKPVLNDICALAFEETKAIDSLLGDASAFCNHPSIRKIFLAANIDANERRECLDSLDKLSVFAKGLTAFELLGMLSMAARDSIARHERMEPITARIMTIEACKGREFKYVAVPFVESGRFPADVASDKAYLERNRLYVATTRAKSRLWLLESEERPTKLAPV